MTNHETLGGHDGASHKTRVAIIGMGTMGTAMSRLMADRFDVIGIDHRPEALAQVAEADVAIIAVKPQSWGELAEQLKPYISHRQLVISIMAGITLKSLGVLGTDRLARTMPNLGIRAGQSLTATFAENLGDADQTTLADVVGTWGERVELDNEDQFHAFTAIGGSGPAYYYLLADAMSEAGEALGLSANVAKQAAMGALRSAGSVVQSGDNPAELIAAVASKRGTTEAGLRKLNTRRFRKTVGSTVVAATNRSREIAETYVS